MKPSRYLVFLIFTLLAVSGPYVFSQPPKKTGKPDAKAEAKELKSKSPIYQKVMAGSEKLIQEYRSKNTKAGNVNVAIMDVDSVGDAVKKLDLGAGIGEMITSQMGKISQVKVIDRKRMKTIMNELSLSLSGVVDETATKQVGRILAADLILTGSVSQIGQVMQVSLRLTDVESAQQVASTQLELPAGELIPAAQVASLEDKYPITAAFRSLSVPGWGHFYNGQPGWGVFYLIGTAGMFGTSLVFTLHGANTYRNYNNINAVNFRDYYPSALSAQDAAAQGYADSQFFLTGGMIGWIATGTFWLVNVLHAGLAAGSINKKKQKFSLGSEKNVGRFGLAFFSSGDEHRLTFNFSY